MNLISRTITGMIGIVLGIVLIILGFLKDISILIYGILILIIGIFILFNKKEDKIEQIKGQKNKNKNN